MARKFRILCVDDEETPLLLRKLLLQKAGYEVFTARTAEEALRTASSSAVDLVLSDYLMPGVTGTQLAQQFKSAHPKLPIILISGVNDIPVDANIADVFFSKLEGPERLCQEIAAVLAQRGEMRSAGE